MLKYWISKFGIAVTNLLGVREDDAHSSLVESNVARGKSATQTTDQVFDRMLDLNGFS